MPHTCKFSLVETKELHLGPKRSLIPSSLFFHYSKGKKPQFPPTLRLTLLTTKPNPIYSRMIPKHLAHCLLKFEPFHTHSN